jgi:hypothetical protein
MDVYMQGAEIAPAEDGGQERVRPLARHEALAVVLDYVRGVGLDLAIQNARMEGELAARKGPGLLGPDGRPIS